MKHIHMLIVLLLVVLFACNLYAEYQAEKPLGEGTKDSPYLMESVENLLWLSDNVTNVASGSYFLQTKNIDANETKDWREGRGFPPIGCGEYDEIRDLFNFKFFNGTYDGNNYKIFGLSFNPSVTNHFIALFGAVTNSCLKNIVLDNVTMLATHYCAGLGAWIASTSISNCHVSIAFTQEDGDGIASIGGLVGHIEKFAEIDSCSAKVKDLKGDNSGGLVGYCYDSAHILDPSIICIRKCFTEGSIYGNWVGGIVGIPGRQPLEDCYSLVDMYGGGINVGGITAFGAGICKNCYHYGKIENGNPISGGNSSGTASGVYYCSEQGTDPNPGTIGKTYAELLKKETYEGWDFENTWYIEEDVSLPTLSWEMPEPGIFSLLVAAFGLFVFKRK